MEFGIWQDGQQVKYVQLSDPGRYLYQYLVDTVSSPNLQFEEFTIQKSWIVRVPGKRVFIQLTKDDIKVEFLGGYNLQQAAEEAVKLLQ